MESNTTTRSTTARSQIRSSHGNAATNPLTDTTDKRDDPTPGSEARDTYIPNHEHPRSTYAGRRHDPKDTPEDLQDLREGAAGDQNTAEVDVRENLGTGSGVAGVGLK